MKNRDKSKTKTKVMTAFKIAIAVLMIAATVSSVVISINAFNAFGYSIGTEGVKKIPYSSETVVEQDGYVNDADIRAAISIANEDSATTDFLKSFSEENFCVKTEKRVAYLAVATDGTLSQLSDKPDKCYEIKTTESYLAKAWYKYNLGEDVTYKEVAKHVKIPFAMKARIALAGLTD